ncbi:MULTISPECIES: hypothetical protein [Empedobacter]|uniref:Uncharacterized protein n=1 Tax=Empedobacter falsenii TaxID=343874 RepID=A0A7H9DTG5_9FLAO|nr:MULTISPECIES: hypothetical protein [Empedobacter]MDH2208693.1 hypothetical protein [Empedobacter sp. GD03644]QLL58026.1 hypothetical protein FH779_08010 [Empedobacter falsenii]
MTEIIKLIKENKTEEIIQNYSESRFKIHELFVNVLKDNLIDDYENIDFESDKYQEEFIEGVEIFKTLVEADLQMEAMMFSTVLVFLGYKTGEFIHLLSNTAMSKGVYLSEISNFKIDARLRNSMQEFYNSMDENYLVPKANIAAAKTRVSQAIFNQITKAEFGNDMLQMGISYEQINEIQMSKNIYQGVMNDFESESVKLSSELFPEITQVDDRNENEIKVYKKAKELLEKITNTKTDEPKRVHINENVSDQQLVEEINKKNEKFNNNENRNLFSKFKKWLS